MSGEAIVHVRRAEFDYYVGRNPRHHGVPLAKTLDPRWANPYEIGKDGSREEVVKKYEVYIRALLANNDALLNELNKMKGKRLACWCAPLLCHISVIIKLIKEYC